MPAPENDVPIFSDDFPVAGGFNRTGSLRPFAAPSTKVRKGPKAEVAPLHSNSKLSLSPEHAHGQANAYKPQQAVTTTRKLLSAFGGEF